MFQKLLKKHYGIEAHASNPIGHYPSCQKENQRFLLIPVSQIDKESLSELEEMALHLKNSGDLAVGTFLHTRENELLVVSESESYCVLTCDHPHSRSQNRLGRKLAKFHYRGRTISFAVQRLSRVGQWHKLWETRIDQMEKVWNSMLYQQPESEFDRMFMESFPYYMAMAENAIQYLVDTEIDDEPKSIDYGTVCHHHFSSHTWGNEIGLRNPFDWVFDHCSRDLAEWTREKYLHNAQTYQPLLQQFYSEYQSIEPLSSFSWRLLYARILFPLHYVECIENYYSTTKEQDQRILTERLEKYLSYSSEYESFLQQFFQLLEVPVRKYRIPTLDWL